MTPYDPMLVDALPPVQRLALAYAPARARAAWLALLALDTRLGGVVRTAHEPLLAQIKLAWWRDRLGEDAARWPKGEPLLAQLAAWRGAHQALGALVDGWEALLMNEDAAALAAARGDAFAALALHLGAACAADSARQMGEYWSLADFGQAPELARTIRQPGVMRPLTVLHGLAQHPTRHGIAALATAMRLGITGF